MTRRRSEMEEKLLGDILDKLDNPADPALVDGVGITALGKLTDKLEFTYTAGGDIDTIKFYKDDGTTLLFTLTFAYDAQGNLISITRS